MAASNELWSGAAVNTTDLTVLGKYKMMDIAPATYELDTPRMLSRTFIIMNDKRASAFRSTSDR